jgi:hypothetical protein
MQPIESVRTFANQTVTLSFWAKAGTGTPKIALEIAQNFGSGGSPSPIVNNYVGQVTLSTSWTRYSLTISLPSIAGKVLGSAGDHLAVSFFTSAGSDFNSRTGSLGIQSATIDIWGVQLEAGPVATPFRRNSNNLQAELAACQRFYYRETATASLFTWIGNTGNASSTTNVIVPFRVPVPLRGIPSLIEFASLTVSDFVNNLAVSAATLDVNAAPNTVVINLATTGATQFRSYTIRANNSASAFIGFQAEL